MTYRELQRECKRRGLPANGNRATLEARLEVGVFALPPEGDFVETEAHPDDIVRLKKPGRPAAPRFTYIGDQREGATNPESTTFRGLVFKLNGPPVAVSDSDTAAKLSGNSHFK